MTKMRLKKLFEDLEKPESENNYNYGLFSQSIVLWIKVIINKKNIPQSSIFNGVDSEMYKKWNV